MSARAVLALGANLGDRHRTLQSAVDALAAVSGLRVVAVSPVLSTDPVGGPEQPDYLNAVVLVDTVLSPRRLLAVCQRIELDHGRERAVRWGPRTLDIDIIDYAGRAWSDEALQLPHPRAAERAFVLVPWLAVDPAAVLPGEGGSPIPVRELLDRLGEAGVRPAAGEPLVVPV